jgi:hypothetical protein
MQNNPALILSPQKKKKLRLEEKFGSFILMQEFLVDDGV